MVSNLWHSHSLDLWLCWTSWLVMRPLVFWLQQSWFIALFWYVVLAKSASYNIYDHDKSARDETSYSLSLKCITGLFLEARNSLGGEEVIGSLRIDLDGNCRFFWKEIFYRESSFFCYWWFSLIDIKQIPTKGCFLSKFKRLKLVSFPSL
jgi:hypothetical protein